MKVYHLTKSDNPDKKDRTDNSSLVDFVCDAARIAAGTRISLLAQLATKAKANLSTKSNRTQLKDKVVTLKNVFTDDPEWPEKFVVEIAHVVSSITHIVPGPLESESAPSKVCLLENVNCCHWNINSGTFRRVRIAVCPLTSKRKITVCLTNVVAEGKFQHPRDLKSIVNHHFSKTHVLCPGLQE